MKTDILQISKNGSSYLGIDSYDFLCVKGANLNGCLGFSKDVEILTDWTRLNIKIKDYFSVNGFTIIESLDNRFFFTGKYSTSEGYERFQYGFIEFKLRGDHNSLNKIIKKKLLRIRNSKQDIVLNMKRSKK